MLEFHQQTSRSFLCFYLLNFFLIYLYPPFLKKNFPFFPLDFLCSQLVNLHDSLLTPLISTTVHLFLEHGISVSVTVHLRVLSLSASISILKSSVILIYHNILIYTNIKINGHIVAIESHLAYHSKCA